MRSKTRLLILLSPLFPDRDAGSLLRAGRALRSRATQPVAVSGSSQRQQGYRPYAGRAEPLAPGKNADEVTARLAGECDRYTTTDR